jgi:hypothetical protein
LKIYILFFDIVYKKNKLNKDYLIFPIFLTFKIYITLKPRENNMIFKKSSKVILAIAAISSVSACSTARFGSDHNDANLLIAARTPFEILNDERYPNPPTKTKIPTTLPPGVYPDDE